MLVVQYFRVGQYCSPYLLINGEIVLGMMVTETSLPKFTINGAARVSRLLSFWTRMPECTVTKDEEFQARDA